MIAVALPLAAFILAKPSKTLLNLIVFKPLAKRFGFQFVLELWTTPLGCRRLTPHSCILAIVSTSPSVIANASTKALRRLGSSSAASCKTCLYWIAALCLASKAASISLFSFVANSPRSSPLLIASFQTPLFLNCQPEIYLFIPYSVIKNSSLSRIVSIVLFGSTASGPMCLKDSAVVSISLPRVSIVLADASVTVLPRNLSTRSRIA